MHRRRLGWLMAVAVAGVGASMGKSGAAHAQDAEGQRVFRIVADVSGSEARLMAVGVSSLAKQRIRGFDFDITWAGFGEDSLELIRDDDNDFALIDLSRVDAGRLATRTDLRAVMKYWPDDQSSAEPPASVNAGYLLVVKPSVEARFVQELVSAVEADGIILKASSIDIAKLDPSMAMADLPLPLHRGVGDDAGEIGSSPVASNASIETVDAIGPASAERPDTAPAVIPVAIEPAQTPIPKPAPGSRSYTVYFDSNEAKLDGGDFESVERACQYASRLPRAKFIISGHTDTVGSAAANKKLAALRATGVADAIRNDPRYREALSVMEFGETKSAIETDDEVVEALNRRVLITIVPDG